MAEYPNNLDYYIRERGIDRNYLAQQLNISVSMLNRHIAGTHAVPMERRQQLAEILGYSLEQLFPKQLTLLEPSKELQEALQEQSSGVVPLKSSVILPHTFITYELPPPELTTRDSTAWFSERLAYIIAFITQWKRQVSFPDFQGVLNRELRMFDEIKIMFDDTDTYFLSRRSALLVIAALPTGLLGLLSKQKSSFIEEEFLPSCAASITACWYLLNGREFASVEQTLSKYMPYLATWARRPSSYQQVAAFLAAQGRLLLGFIELHRLHFQERVIYCREAVIDAREGNNQSLLVKALTQLGNAYYDQKRYSEMLHTYLEAKTFLPTQSSHHTTLPPTLQSKVLMGLAHAYAQHGKTKEALNAFSEAQAIFLDGQDEDLPPFLSADEGLFSLILFEGWIRLDLGRHNAKKEHASYAAKALSQIESFPSSALLPERIRIEITNRRAQAAIALGDMDAFHSHTLASIESLQTIASAKRREEVITNYKAARQLWPREGQVLELADALL